MQTGIHSIRIRKGDTVFHVHGDKAGQEGVWLAHGQVQGIYDAPVRTTWKTGAFQAGSTQKSRKWLHRDLTLGFHIKETFTSYEFNESLFRQIFDYEEDPWDPNYEPTTIEVETALSGVRKLDVLMWEQPDFDADIDPQQQQHGNLILKLRAGQPFWYSDDVTSNFSATTSSATGFVTVSNPTDQVMHQKWVLTRGTWTLPDYSWSGARGERAPSSSRTVSDITITQANGGAVIDLDRQELMLRDQNNTNILAQLSGKFFEYPIPPYTPARSLPVSYITAPAGGATVQLRQPRRWSRPWGMELASEAQDIYAGDLLTTFSLSGSYTYTIPDGATHVDVVLLGAGGGGGGGGVFTGRGGNKGSWFSTTLVRGSTIPTSVTQISGVVGAGGVGGRRGDVNNGGNGEATTARAGNWTGTGAGGEGSGNPSNILGVHGLGAGALLFQGRQYMGSDDVVRAGEPGDLPGGGGAGGKVFGNGGAGGRGQAWFYAYQLGGS